jgi:hypothetical protein
MRDKQSLEALRKRARELVADGRLKHWDEIARALSQEGFPLAAQRLDLDTAFRRSLFREQATSENERRKTLQA